MDPNLFHLDWSRTAEVLAGVVILAFFVERVAALVFESRWFVLLTKVPQRDSPEGNVECQSLEQAIRIREITHDLTIEGKATQAKLSQMTVELSAISASLGPRDLLWPLDPSNPGMARDKANQAIDELEKRQRRRGRLGPLPTKELGAFAVAAWICVIFDFDAISMILLSAKTSTEGALFTAAIVAGGSKASIKFFHDVMGVKSNAIAEMRDAAEPSSARNGARV